MERLNSNPMIYRGGLKDEYQYNLLGDLSFGFFYLEMSHPIKEADYSVCIC